jgi:hypothetical protein
VRRTLGRERSLPRHRNQYVDVQAGQFRRETDEAFGLFVGEAMFEDDVLAVDVAEGLEALHERPQRYLLFLGAAGVPQDSDSGNLSRLPLREGRRRRRERRRTQSYQKEPARDHLIISCRWSKPGR